MKPSKFTEPEEAAVERQCYAIMQSAQGKAWGRHLLREIGKGEDGDYAGIKNQMLDILSRVINALYMGSKPVQSR